MKAFISVTYSLNSWILEKEITCWAFICGNEVSLLKEAIGKSKRQQIPKYKWINLNSWLLETVF